MSQQVTQPSFLFLAQQSTSPLTSSVSCENNGTKPTCITLSKQKRADTQRAHEAARFHLQASQLRRNALTNSKSHGPRYKPSDSVGLHSSVTLRDSFQSFHPQGEVHSQLYSVSTTLIMKSETQRTKKRPSFIMTV